MTIDQLKEALAGLHRDQANLEATLSACRGAIQQTMWYIQQEEQREVAKEAKEPEVTPAKVLAFPKEEATHA